MSPFNNGCSRLNRIRLNSYTDSYSDCYTYPNEHSGSDCYGHVDTDSQLDIDSDADANRDSDADADGHRHTGSLDWTGAGTGVE